jgi:DNA integrity scanning protein DisA with diadenylate cyclase activity
MSAILRIFKYCRKRIIKLSIENRQLKMQLEYLRATLNKDEYTKH